MSAKAKRKPPGASADAPAQKSAATGERVALDKGQLAEVFRRVARQSQHAARLNQELADAANQLADKFAPPAADTATRPSKKTSVQNG